MMTPVSLSIGSNIGDRAANLRLAVHLLTLRPEIKVVAVSPVYETEPVGGVVQRSFYNLAVQLETRLTASDLLHYLHVIEQSLHRRRLVHWGPRTIDLDIIYYGNRQFKTATLKVPHPEMANRRFVLVPLLTVLPAGDQRQQGAALLAQTPDHNWLTEIIGKEEVQGWI